MNTSATHLARDCRRQADLVNEIADRVEAWGTSAESRTAYAALGLIETAQDLVRNAERIYANDLLGPNTKASFRNEAAIALGATNGHSARGRGDLAYGIMHAMYSMEKYGKDTELANMKVKASQLRVHAASCRVVAGLLDELASGAINRIG